MYTRWGKNLNNTDPTTSIDFDASVTSTIQELHCNASPSSSTISDQFGQPIFTSSPSKLDNINETVLSGVRLVDISFFIKQLTEASNHNPTFGCTLSNMHVVREMYRGLSPFLVFKCRMCNIEIHVPTHDQGKDASEMNINTRAVAGIMSIGGGFSHLEEFSASIGLPCMSGKAYTKYHGQVCDGWEKAAALKMAEACAEEAEIAVERGEIDTDGVPILTVVADGCWSKRSYRTNYNALSGVAAIVGFHTQKVIYMGVKNKYCIVYARKTNEGKSMPHICYKNWAKSSTSMEAGIIVGFKQSESMYKVRYGKLIADGDSSCYKQILDARP